MNPPVCPSVPAEVMTLAWAVFAVAVVLVGVIVVDIVVRGRRG